MRAGPPAGAAFGLPLVAGLSPPLSAPLPLAAALPGLASPFAAGAPPAAAAGFSALAGFAGLSSFGALSALGFLSVSAIDLGSRTLGESDLLAVRLELEADAGRLAVLRIGERDVGQVDRQL